MCIRDRIEIAELEKAVTGYEQSQKSAEKFIALIDKYENFDTLTNTMLNEMCIRDSPCTPTKTVHPPLASVPFLRVLLSYPGGDTPVSYTHLPTGKKGASNMGRGTQYTGRMCSDR